jgi:hypothetical protein
MSFANYKSAYNPVYKLAYKSNLKSDSALKNDLKPEFPTSRFFLQLNRYREWDFF